MNPEPTPVQKIALAITQWVGSVPSIGAHSAFFVLCFVFAWFDLVELNTMLLVLTTIVSLEAIYLAIFIQMTVNLQGKSIHEVEKDIDEIQEDIDEMQEDVEEIQEDIDEMQEDVDELQEDVEDIEEIDEADQVRKNEQKKVLESIQQNLQRLLADMEQAKRAETPVSENKKPAPKKRAKKNASASK